MSYRRKVSWLGLVAACAALPTLALGDSAHDKLARDVDRAESMRAVKNLQRTYAQYSQYGLWNEMAQLLPAMPASSSTTKP
ncbi:MAG TPA: hypothetical protein VN645_06165 [Steroidobacteraceae bacterium]|nr:hypothetical protein [Steroidobacteraceae bacterium]